MPSPTQRWGAEREADAERALVRAGYHIVERNWRGAGAEIDRIAWDDDILCIVEVRARESDACGTPAETIGRAKQRHLVRGALAYLVSRFEPGSEPMVRFDVVSVVDRKNGPRTIEIIANAFVVEVR